MDERLQSLLAALALDLLVPELPNALHPVAWMGQWLTLGERLAPKSEAGRLVWGGWWVAGGMGLSAALAWSLPRHVLLQGTAAQLLFAYSMLDQAVGEVQVALVDGDLDEARRLLSWHLVSRPTADLNESEIAAAAIESLAENLSDSVVAPSLWYLLGGLPALAAYRFSNTADAMWGYRNERYERLGKAAARCDDLLNWVPARLTALLIVIAAPLATASARGAWHIALRDHGRTASPNAGWPMAAMAGALDTTLSKVEHYQLGSGSQRPDVQLINLARRIVRTAFALIVAALVLGCMQSVEEKA